MATITFEWRCTRNVFYRNKNCMGHDDFSTRQGYYIRADTEVEALMQMVRQFPQDVIDQSAVNAFTVDKWREIKEVAA